MAWLKELFGGLRSKIRSRDKKGDLAAIQDIGQREAFIRDLKLTDNLNENIKTIGELYGNSPDLIFRHFRVGAAQIPGALLCLDGMVAPDRVEEILKALEIEAQRISVQLPKGEGLLASIEDGLLPSHQVQRSALLGEICHRISSGETALLFAGVGQSLICDTSGFATRSITEPTSETTIRGPRVGFIESIETNITLLRRRIKTPNLWIENYQVGDLTQTQLSLVYIKGLASEELLTEVRSRLKRIRVDGVLESGHVEEYIEDTPFTLFPMVLRTERPDRVVGNLLEGNVALLTDGTPFVMTLPAKFVELLQSPDDYYDRSPIGSLTRFLRFAAYLISILLPGIYVATINFHQELIPTTLLLRISAAREGLPFPVVVEALMMELAFEILREAGVRLPQAIGSAISIVGALILGEAAIRAGIVSPIIIIIVALTAISSFTAPVYSIGISARILRFFFIGLGAAFGLFGIQAGILLFLIHLCSLRSFGIPYFAPLGPLIWADWKDTFIRMFFWGLTTRPKLTGAREPQRAQGGQRPGVEMGKRREEE